MYCVSISHKTAPAEIREKFNFCDEEKLRILREMTGLPSVEEALILCTCNRSEFYFCGGRDSEKEVRGLISQESGAPAEDIKGYFRSYSEKKAVEHIFRVACGIDSMIIGEDEILGQVKNAYGIARRAGTAGYSLNSIFQKAIACAKKIKTDTPLSKTSVSAATLTAKAVFQEDFGKEQKQVLLIGATGEMGRAILNNLLSKPDVYIICPLRKNTGLFLGGFSSRWRNRVRFVDYAERYDFIDGSDVVISATASPHYTVILKEIEKKSPVPRKRLFIDIAVPRDIDEDVLKLPEARLITIDDFEAIARENNKLKLKAVSWAEDICLRYQDELYRDMIFHREFGGSHGLGDDKAVSFNKLLYRAKKEMDCHGFAQLVKIMKEINGTEEIKEIKKEKEEKEAREAKETEEVKR